MKSTPLLSISNLSVNFGGLKALADVFIEVNSQEVVGLIGPNGAGKTTLFNAISGLVKPASGTISLNDKNISWPEPHQLASLSIARTLQGVSLFSGLTVVENVMMGADQHRKSNFFRDISGFSTRDEAQLKERAMQALAWAGAHSLADKFPNQLTYPDSKRVALARALVLEPTLLLLDEPAAGLGQDDIDKLSALIRQIKRKCAVLVVEHHVEFVSQISDKVYVLNFGKVIAHGTFDQVKKDPGVMAAYLGTSTQSQTSVLGGN